ncbi:MAG: TolC family protein [Stenotrophobium sp.]
MRSAASSGLALLLCGAMAASLPLQARAADTAATAQTSSLTDLIEALKTYNPQLIQARQNYLAAKLVAPQVEAEPGAQFGLLEQANTGGPFDFNKNSGFFAYYNFTQPILWPGKRRLAGEVAKAQAEVVGRQYDSLVLQLVSQLKLSFYQLMALQDQLRFMDEDQQRLEQIKEVTKVQYANNAAAYVDYLNAQVSASSLENDRFSLQKQILTAREQINTLLGRSSQEPLNLRDADITPHMPSKPLKELIVLAQDSNPVIAGGASQIEAADKSVSLAKKAYYPDFQFVVGAFSDPPLNIDHSARMYSVGVNLTLPTWFFEKEKAGVGQASALLDAAQANQASNLQQVELNVASAYHGLETAIQQVKFTHERLLPQARMAYRLALTSYSSNGGAAFSQLLTAQSGLRSTELSLVQSENAALQAYVSLTAAIGRDPN